MGLLTSGHHFYCGTNASFRNGITLGFQFFIMAFFHSIFSLEVNNIGALFCLFITMSAYFYQGFNHPFKGIHIVIPNDQPAGFLQYR